MPVSQLREEKLPMSQDLATTVSFYVSVYVGIHTFPASLTALCYALIATVMSHDTLTWKTYFQFALAVKGDYFPQYWILQQFCAVPKFLVKTRLISRLLCKERN